MVCLSCRVNIPSDGWCLCEKCYSGATGFDCSGNRIGEPVKPDPDAYKNCIFCKHPKFRHVKEECITEDDEFGICRCKHWSDEGVVTVPIEVAAKVAAKPKKKKLIREDALS